MASPDSRNLTSDEAEVTSENRAPDSGDHQGEYNDVDLDYPLVRHNSIYSLTLDEIQNTVCEPGRNFGSMNMDEFLTNIWNAEEGQGQGQQQPQGQGQTGGAATSSAPVADVNSGGLQRQGSLSVPPPLSRKTVEEVWTEINRVQGGGPATTSHGTSTQPPVNETSAATGGRQATFGEMTLEDFLVKAGVVREPVVNVRGAAPSAQFGPMAGFPMGTELGGVYGPHGMVGGVNMNGGMNMMHGLMVGPSMGSAEMPDGMVDEVTGYDRANGRKRTGVSAGIGVNGGEGSTVEKVVERRQRRMIKNRESAARSRARKQAYTVELEAELNQLKEENTRLKEEEKRVLAIRRQMLLETMAERSHANAEKARAALRRSTTCVW